MSVDPDFYTHYPNLDTLFGAYFHQDFYSEYGSADGTIDAFMADVGAERCAAFLCEMQELLQRSSDESLERALEIMGNSFAFETLGIDARQWMERIVVRVAAAGQ